MTMERRDARRTMPIRLYRLGEEPGNDLTPLTSAAERLAMVALLSRRMWRLTGQPEPAYTRATISCVVLHPK
ncbi:MAG: hypothetical protein ABIR59_02905 [Gemmatimonadales bacterium]